MNGKAARCDARPARPHWAATAGASLCIALSLASALFMGGFGAALFVLVVSAAALLTRRSRAALMRAALGATVIWTAVSFAAYVGRDNGETVTTRAATWARNHGMGPVVDQLEVWAYSDPPSVAPAGELAVEPGVGSSVPSTSTSTSTPSTSTDPVQPTPGPDDPASSTTAPATTSTPTTAPASSGPPSALTPVFDPPLDGEGVWTPVAEAGGQDVIWATGIRPLRGTGGVVATVVAIDRSRVRAGLFNGSEQPGGTWRRGNRVPAELRPAVLGAMNGGFRFDHIQGGYVTEGKVVRPLHDGDATLAVDRSGRLVVGKYGRDLTDDGTWVSLRQNLRLMVDDGTSMVRDGIAHGVWWGADYGNQVYVPRSGLCELRNGMVAYVLAGPVDAEQFAQVMIAVGCRLGMQLDINGTWPAFDVYGHDGGTLAPKRLDRRMSPNVWRYLDGSSKEFVAFFDPALVPEPSVLDD